MNQTIAALWSDFLGLTPTARVSFAITVCGFLGGIGYWGILQIRHDSPPPAQPPPVLPDSSAGWERILRMVERGDADLQQATEFARVVYNHAPASPAPLHVARDLQGDPSADTPADAAADAQRDDQRAFVRVAAELARSNLKAERDVILSYARGNVAAAFEALTRRAEQAGPDGAEIWREIAALAGHRDQARAIAALNRVLSLEPGDDASRVALAKALMATDRHDEAIAHLHQVVETAADRHLRLRALNRLATAYRQSGRLSEAATSIEQAIELARAGMQDCADDVEGARLLAMAYATRGLIRKHAGHLIDARAATDQALRLFDALVADFPDDERIILSRMQTYMTRADCEHEAGYLEAATETLAQAIESARAAVARFPDNLWISKEQARAMILLANRRREKGEDSEAAVCYEVALALLTEILTQDPTFAAARQDAIWCRIEKSKLALADGQVGRAASIMARLRIDARAAAATGAPDAQDTLGAVLYYSARLEEELGDFTTARSYSQEARAIGQHLATQDPSNRRARHRARYAAFQMGNIARLEGDFDAYRDTVRQILAEVADELAGDPGNWSLKNDLAGYRRTAAFASLLANHLDEAGAHAAEGIDLARRNLRDNPGNIGALHGLGEALRIGAQVEMDRAHLDTAEQMLAEAMQHADAAIAAAPENVHSVVQKVETLAMVMHLANARADSDTAIASGRQALDLSRRLHLRSPRSLTGRQRLVSQSTKLADTLAANAHTLEATRLCQEALELLRAGNHSPTRDERMSELVVLDRLARLSLHMGKSAEAARHRADCFALTAKLAENQADLQAQRNMASVLVGRATEALEAGDEARIDDAVKALQDFDASMAKAHPGLIEIGQNLREIRFSRALRRSDIDLQIALLHEMSAAQAAEIGRSDTVPARLLLIDLQARLAVTETEIAPERAKVGLLGAVETLSDLIARDAGNRAILGRAHETLARLRYTATSLQEAGLANRLADDLVGISGRLLEQTPDEIGALRRHIAGLLARANARMPLDERQPMLDAAAEADRVLTRLANVSEDRAELLDHAWTILNLRRHALDRFETEVEFRDSMERLAELLDQQEKAAPQNRKIPYRRAALLQRQLSLALFDGDAKGAGAFWTRLDGIMTDLAGQATHDRTRYDLEHIRLMAQVEMRLHQGDLDAVEDLLRQAAEMAPDPTPEARAEADLLQVLAEQTFSARLLGKRQDAEAGIAAYGLVLQSVGRFRDRHPQNRLIDWVELKLRFERYRLTGQAGEWDWIAQHWQDHHAQGRAPVIAEWSADIAACVDGSAEP